MASFLFWNVHNNDRLKDALVALVHARRIDVLVLAECPAAFKNAGLLLDLNRRRADEYHYSPPATQGYKDVVIYTRYASQVISLSEADGTRFTFRKIELLGGKPPVLLAAAHLPSKFPNRSPAMQIEDARELSEGIVRVEEQTQIRRTVLVGDLNSNPFEQGMAFAQGLHAVMTRRLAQGNKSAPPGERLVEKRRYRTFYNPMWRHYGEMDGMPAGSHYGTFYYDGAGRENLYWHILDQVLIRAELLPQFRDDSLEIVTQAGDFSLLTKDGIPDSKRFSDHLPIAFELEL